MKKSGFCTTGVPEQPTPKTKVFLASSVFVQCPPEHRANNGNSQFTVLVRTTNRKRLAEILHVGAWSLSNFHSAHVVTEPKWTAIAVKPDVIYYHVEHTKAGFLDQWFEAL